MTLKKPAEAMSGQLADVDANMRNVIGEHPAAFVQANMAAAQVQATCALVHAVRELTDEVRKAGASQRGGEQLGRTIEFMTGLMRAAVRADTPQQGIDMLREALAEVDVVAGP
ncbi:hypothetical protein OHR68_09850 [Spirillospora sp. NBC_00431]